MSYKTTTIILAVLLIAALVYIFTSDANDDEDGVTVADEEVKESRSENQAVFLVPNPRVADTTGGFITAATATRKLSDAITWRNTEVNNLGVTAVPYGFSFGLKRLKKLMSMIEEINQDLQPYPDSAIAGVRVHLGISTGPFGKDGADINYLDVFMLPVRANGNNYIYIGEDEDKQDGFSSTNEDDPILNTSKPCPDLCD